MEIGDGIDNRTAFYLLPSPDPYAKKKSHAHLSGTTWLYFLFTIIFKVETFASKNNFTF